MVEAKNKVLFWTKSAIFKMSVFIQSCKKNEPRVPSDIIHDEASWTGTKRSDNKHLIEHTSYKLQNINNIHSSDCWLAKEEAR